MHPPVCWCFRTPTPSPNPLLHHPGLGRGFAGLDHSNRLLLLALYFYLCPFSALQLLATAHVTPLLRSLPSPVSHSQGPHRGPLTLTTDHSFYPCPAAPWPSSLPTLPHAFLQVSAKMPSYQRPSLSTLHKRAPSTPIPAPTNALRRQRPCLSTALVPHGEHRAVPVSVRGVDQWPCPQIPPILRPFHPCSSPTAFPCLLLADHAPRAMSPPQKGLSESRTSSHCPPPLIPYFFLLAFFTV